MSKTSSDSKNDSFSDDDSEYNHYLGKYVIIETEIMCSRNVQLFYHLYE